jgi:hypothetical protein
MQAKGFLGEYLGPKGIIMRNEEDFKWMNFIVHTG